MRLGELPASGHALRAPREIPAESQDDDEQNDNDEQANRRGLSEVSTPRTSGVLRQENCRASRQGIEAFNHEFQLSVNSGLFRVGVDTGEEIGLWQLGLHSSAGKLKLFGRPNALLNVYRHGEEWPVRIDLRSVRQQRLIPLLEVCLLYTSDAADDAPRV